MGSLSSTCKGRKRAKMITIIHDKCTQTAHPVTSVTDSSSCHHYSHMCTHSISSLRSTVLSKSSNNRINILARRPDGSITDVLHRISPRTDLSRVRLRSTTVRNTFRPESYQASSTIIRNEQSNIAVKSHGVKGSTSIPINTFLIDISNEQVRIGEPVSLHIRHLLLKPSTADRTKSSATTDIYTRENLLHYIPDVCETYPNLTMDSDQPTRHTLHARLPT